MGEDREDEVVVAFGEEVVLDVWAFGEALAGVGTSGDGEFGLAELVAFVAV